MSLIDLILSQPSILTAVLVVIGGIVSTVVPIVAREVYRIRNRLDELETKTTRHSRTLYGDTDDPTHSGLAQQLSEIESTLETMTEQMDAITRAISTDESTTENVLDDDNN